MKELQFAGASLKRAVSDETDDTSKRTNKWMKDHMKMTSYSDIGDILPGEDVLGRLRNECFVDI
jgi:hypothetical protein